MRPVRVASMLSVLALAALAALAAAQAFEGTIRQKMVMLGPQQVTAVSGAAGAERPDLERLFATSFDKLATIATPMGPGGAAGAMELGMSVKADKMRIDMTMPAMEANPMGSMYMLMEGNGGFTVVMPAMRRAMVMSPEARKSAMAMAGDAQKNMKELVGEGDVKIRELGPKTINGMATVGYEVTRGLMVMRAWVAPELRSVGAAMKAMQQTMKHNPMFRNQMDVDPTEFIGDKGFPVRSLILMPVPAQAAATMGAGWTMVASEITAVEKKALGADVFTVPAGFQVMQMPTMGGGPPK